MPERTIDRRAKLNTLESHGINLYIEPGNMFAKSIIHFLDANTEDGNIDMEIAKQTVRFCGGSIARSLEDAKLTHVVIADGRDNVAELRRAMSRWECFKRSFSFPF